MKDKGWSTSYKKYKIGLKKWQVAKEERQGIGKKPSMPTIA